MTRQVLLVDDDPVQRRLSQAHLGRAGYGVVACGSGTEAVEALRVAAGGHRLPVAMVLDLMMPGLDGLGVMAEMRRLAIDLPVIVQTARGGVDTVVAAMRAGAFDFVVKPVAPDKLAAAVEQAAKLSLAARRRPARRTGSESPVAGSAAMVPVIEQAMRAARSAIPVLIEGETGVGKEWLAEAIRANGPRAGRPFVAVNCGALPAALAESTLFGHEKGAFTDAAERRPGRFVEADGGTIFLDEIGELPLDVQVKLLRVLQNGEIEPVGGRGGRRVDVRIISATHRDLAADVAAGRFREDLFYRLSVLPIEVPPLRERRAEIGPLAAAFLAAFSGGTNPSVTGFTPEASALLDAYDWPGNIRQLENAVHRAVVLAGGERLGVEDFPQIAGFSAGPPAAGLPQAPAPAALPSLRAFDEDGDLRTAEAVEADLIRMAMLRYGGRMSEIARRLGIGRSTLYRKMRQYSLDDSPANETSPH